MPSTTTTTAATSPPGSCDGVPTTGWSCCTTTNPCNVGGGDCDYDGECADGLSCGTNNCLQDFSIPGSGWSGSADCCAGMIERSLEVLNLTFH